MIKLSVKETKWSSLLARAYALILYISISIFGFGPEKLPGRSRNGPQVFRNCSFSCGVLEFSVQGMQIGAEIQFTSQDSLNRSGWRANAQSFYGSKFILSTQLIMVRFLFFLGGRNAFVINPNTPPTWPPWRHVQTSNYRNLFSSLSTLYWYCYENIDFGLF